jgi:O-antigen/teichoic acid export membrane protein
LPDKSIKAGTAWTVLFFLSSFAKTLVLTPLMLTAWGGTGFCFWAIILSARSVILFLTDAYVRYIANRYNLLFHTDEPKANEVLRAGVSFLLVFSIVLCIAAGAAFVLFPSLSSLLFDVDTGYALRAGLPVCLLTYLSAACVQNVQRMLAATKEARGLVAHNMVLEVVLVLLELSVLGILLAKGYGLYTGVLADSIVISVIAVAYIVHLLYRYPLLCVMQRQTLRTGAREFIKAGSLYGGNFFEKLSTDGLVLLLSLFRFSKVAIALFATVRTMVNTPILAQNLLLNTYTPSLQKKFVLRDVAGLQRLFRFVRLYLGGIIMLGIVCCYPLYEPVFVFWTQGKLAYNESFMVSMLLVTICTVYGTGFAFVLKGLNLLPELLRLMLLRTVLVLIALSCSGADPDLLGWSLAGVELVCSVVYLPLVLQKFWRREQLCFSYAQSIKALLPYLLAALFLLLMLAWQPVSFSMNSG